MAYEYARRGARLVLVARREDQLRAVADRAITKGASDVHVLVGDMTKEDDCKSVIDATIHKYGRCKLDLCSSFSASMESASFCDHIYYFMPLQILVVIFCLEAISDCSKFLFM